MGNTTELEKLCEKHRITLTLVKNGAFRPIDEDWYPAHCYKATLRYKGRQITASFYTGSGWTEDPNSADVLGALISDATSYEGSSDIDDFANEFGIKASKAPKIYNACKRMSERLHTFLGDDFDLFANAEH